MSTVIDQRVVEMRFDNKQFEANVNTTMSTLDKLKQKLNFKGASQGLQDVGAAANKVNMNGLSGAVETVSAKFSALQVVGVTALANLTNSAINTGKRMLSALTIDPVKTGFQEYETQMNAVQTILANTASKGTTIKDVNKALDELNTYADKTIYNFTEMTRNIGTFTAAGIDLETSTNAIQGIANLAAVSGSNSQQASTAMYQLSQALAAGTVKLMDWNSVVNAGMGGEMFQNALKETSRLLGTGADEAIEAAGSFRESLSQGWITAEVLTETLKKFTTSGANEYIAEYTGMTKEAVAAEVERCASLYDEKIALDKAAESLAKMSGKSKDEIKNALEFAKNAEDAATKVKTFTQLWDVLKESAQSGWSQTWKLIVGDFEAAKALLSPLAEFLTGIINKFSDARNTLLKGALGKGFDHISKVIKGVTKPIKASADSIKKVVETVEDYSDVVNRIIGGEFGVGQARWDKLTEAGYDWAHAQNLVNEKLGDSTRHATEYKEVQNGIKEVQEESAESQDKMTDSQVKYIASLTEMSEGLLRSKGYTSEQINAFKDLKEMTEKTGIPIEDFIKNIDEIDGRWLIFNALKNIGLNIVNVFKSIGEAFRDAFPPMQSDTLFNLIAGFHKLTTKMILSEETLGYLTRTLKGVFAIVDVLTTILGGGFKIAFKVVSAVLSHFNLGFLEFTAMIGDALVSFRDWFDSLFDISGVVSFLIDGIAAIAKNVKEWIASFKEIPQVKSALDSVSAGIDKLRSMSFDEFISKVRDKLAPALAKAAEVLKKWFNSFKSIPQVQNLINKISGSFEKLKELDFSKIGNDIVEGLKNGLGEGAAGVVAKIIQLAKDLISQFCAILGIESPSKVFMTLGGFIIAGLLAGLVKNVPEVNAIFTNIVDGIKDVIGNVNWGKLFAVLASAGMLKAIINISKAISSLASPLGGLGDLLGNTAEFLAKSTKNINRILKGFGKTLNAFAFSIKAKALKNIGIALLMLVAAVVVLALVPQENLWKAVGIVAVLAVILGVLAASVGLMSKASASISRDGVQINNVTSSLLSIGLAILLLGATVKMIGGMSADEYKQGLDGISTLILSMISILVAFGIVEYLAGTSNADKVGAMMLKISIALALMVGVCKLVAKLDGGEIGKGIAAMAIFATFAIVMGFASSLANEHVSKFGSMMIKVAIALGLFVGVIKLVGMLSETDIENGKKVMYGFVGFMTIMAIISRLSKGIKGLGTALLAISISMVILIGVCKLVGILTPEDVLRGGIAIAAFAGIIFLLVKVMKGLGSDTPKLAGTLLAFSAAIGILAVVAILLSLIDLPGLMRGVTAVTILGMVMAAMIKATKNATDCKSNLIVMTVAIGILAAAVIALSFINPVRLAGATAAMSILMGMFVLIEKMSSNVTGSMGTMIVMTVVVGLLAGILWLLQGLPVENTLAVAVSLSLLMFTLSASLKIISGAGPVAATALIPMALMVVIMGLLGGVLYLLKDLPVESTMANAVALSVLVASMALVAALLGALAPAMVAAQAGVISFGIVIAELALVLAALGGLAQIPGLQWLIGEGGDFLQTIGTAIGQFVGGIIGGIAEGAMSTLPQIGTYLSEFMTNAEGFISGAQGISPEMMEGVKTLAEALLIITGAQLLNQLTSWISGGSSISDFGTQLAEFGGGIKAFSDSVVGLDTAAITTAATAAKEMAKVAEAIPPSGASVWSLLAGEQNLGTFGVQLAAFGAGMKLYSDSIVGLDVGAIEASAIAAQGLAKVANAIPKNGDSVWAALSGEQNLATFGSQLKKFGRGMKDYAAEVTGLDAYVIGTSVSAAKGIVQVANAIPKNGTSLWSLIAGGNDLGKFGTQLKKFGKGMKDYAKEVTGIDTGAINTSVNAAKSLVKVANAIPESGDGIWAKLTGKQNLGDFGEKLEPFGKSLKKYANAVKGVEASSIESSISGAKSLIKFIQSLGDIDASGIDSFKSAVSSLAETNVSGFVKAFNGSATKMSSAGGTMITNILKGVNSSKGSLASSANSIVTSFASSISSKSNAMTTVGTALANKFISGFDKSKSKVKSAATNMVSACTTALRGKYQAFYNAGSYLVDGFCKGISQNSYKAAAKAKAMAQAAEKAAKEELAINSPSKKFIKIGEGVPEGFIIGISRFGNQIKQGARNMADTAMEGTKDAMNWVAKAMNSDIEYQPVIRPVMDLGGVSTGVNAINGMLNDRTMGISTNLNAVNSMMNGFGQNGNDDVVNAIDKLGKLLNNTGTTNYNINGVTYDDGSNIHSAVEAIVRAARIGGRV